jgi:hypothetical protein
VAPQRRSSSRTKMAIPPTAPIGCRWNYRPMSGCLNHRSGGLCFSGRCQPDLRQLQHQLAFGIGASRFTARGVHGCGARALRAIFRRNRHPVCRCEPEQDCLHWTKRYRLADQCEFLARKSGTRHRLPGLFRRSVRRPGIGGCIVQPSIGARLSVIPSPRWRVELGALLQGLGVDGGSFGWGAPLIGSYALTDYAALGLGFRALASRRDISNGNSPGTGRRSLS